MFFNAMPGIEAKHIVGVDASSRTVRVLCRESELPNGLVRRKVFRPQDGSILYRHLFEISE